MEQDFVEELRICEEYYQLPLDPETGEAAESPCKYHHIYLRTKDGQRYQYIKDILLAFTGTESWSIKIPGCHSKIACLKYISKAGWCPFLYNVQVSHLSLYAQSWYHAKTEH